MSDLKCPRCASPEVIGREITGIYDDVLYWVCGSCDHGWARDFDPSAYRLNLASKEYAARHNNLRRQRQDKS